MSEFVLSPRELQELTGKSERAQKHYGSQATVLAALRIPFTPRPDKTLIVYREHTNAPRPTTQKQLDSPTVLL